jgi:hypothetical protein
VCLCVREGERERSVIFLLMLPPSCVWECGRVGTCSHAHTYEYECARCLLDARRDLAAV